VERGRVHKSHIVLKLSGIDDRDTAEELRDAVLKLPEGNEADLPADTYLASRLVGLNAESTEGEKIGAVVGILPTPAHDVFVIDAQGKEILVPAVKQFIIDVDIEAGRIVIAWMEGLW
jgi:16S rRNA processing protein RimM